MEIEPYKREAPHKTKVIKYSLSGKIMCVYNTIKEASIDTNVASSSICLCCKGKRGKAGNYMWRYAEK